MKRTSIQTLFGNAAAFSGHGCAQIVAPVQALVFKPRALVCGEDEQAP